MKRSFLCFILTILLFIFLISSCSSNKTKAEGSNYTFGATYWTMANPYFVAMDEAIRAAVEAKGDTLISYDPQGNQTTQISQIEDLITQSVDFIILNPCDWQGVKPGLEVAQKAGIPIIVVDTPVYDSDMVLQTVWSDNYKAGELCAKDLLTRLNSGNIVILDLPTDKSAIERYNGFVDTIEDAGGFDILDVQNGEGATEPSLRVMEDMIQAYGDEIDVAFGINDPSALGIYSALEAAGMSEDVLIYGVDGSPDVKAMIKDGKITATAAQFPKEIGRVAVEQAYKKLAGESIEKEVLIPVEIINSDTIDNYTIDGWE